MVSEGAKLVMVSEGAKRRSRTTATTTNHELCKGTEMISVTRLNGQSLMVNCDLIETVEITPDTVVTLTSGNKLVLRETPDEIQAKVAEFKHRIYAPSPVTCRLARVSWTS